ncbi:4Fe-4S dicluster domain-containing protein [Telmatospirillum sp.]|uniref:4Fe-4S dicluster domain-containing protein n=1 Tax=Telmatospirillum sp. TaxID=2079197 RepID=UPI00284DD92D|nr:4Fe-4S dicluster domain-containing protein [Telmatospirillum sp.]MDR3440896.1 4Fe-4S dicluster domain-containing protein [Telmatospirillum sp.]
MTRISGTKVVFGRPELDRLIALLRADGYRVIGPCIADGAVVYDEVTSTEDLPEGWRDDSQPGRYRLDATGDGELFGYGLGAQGWKRFLYPPRQMLFRAEKAGRGFRIQQRDDDGTPPLAFLGVRACELAAIGVFDRVFHQKGFEEPGYLRRRTDALVIAVECARAADSCFCVSMHTGPALPAGYDLRLNEVVDGTRHVFVAEAGSERGAALLDRLSVDVPPPALVAEAAGQAEAASRQQRRRMDPDVAGILARSLESNHWEEVAKRCLTCGNCTMVCPTCFCTTVEDVTDLSGNNAERWRTWDSCFTIDYSHIAGGALRQKASSRYRQWMTHKLSTWHQQFGVSGCVGCGRCITWCPVGIDITEEAAALAQAEGTSAAGQGHLAESPGDAGQGR